LAIDAIMLASFQAQPSPPKPRAANFGFQKKPQEVRLPGWPRGMPAEMAAAYVGLPLEAWEGIVAAGDAPAAIALTPEHRVWLRETLDAWLDKLGGSPKSDIDARLAEIAAEEGVDLFQGHRPGRSPG
jgi:hypothetical protein